MFSTLTIVFSLAASGGCSSPRDILTMWQRDTEGARSAVRCTTLPDDMDDVAAALALAELRRVLDARGVIVHIDDAPDNPDHKDARTQELRYVPVPSLPELELVKTTRGWGFSPSTLRQARRLHEETFVVDLKGLSERHLPAWTQRTFFGVALWQMMAVTTLVVLGWALRLVISALFLAQVRRVLKRFNLQWSDAVIQPAVRAVGLLVWAGIIAIWLPVVGLPAGLSAMLMIAVRLVAATSVVLVAYRLVDVVTETLEERARSSSTKLDDQLVPLVRRALKFAIVAIGFVFVLQNLQVDVASLLAGLGLGGLAFALAAKDTISHLFGSATIFVDKPFQIGDWIAACGVEGVVEEVGFRSTRVRTFYNSVVSIPNGKLTDAVIDNYGLRQFRRTSVTFELVTTTKPDQVEAFVQGIREIIAKHEKTRKDFYEVHCTGIVNGCPSIMMYFFFKVANWSEELKAKHEVFIEVTRLAERLGVKFLTPTRTVVVAMQGDPSNLPNPLPPMRPTEALPP